MNGVPKVTFIAPCVGMVRYKWVDLRTRMIEWKGKPAFQTVVRDITDRKRAERMLTESEEKYRLLAGRLIDQVWIMDLNLKWTYISPSAEKLWGYTLENIYHAPVG